MTGWRRRRALCAVWFAAVALPTSANAQETGVEFSAVDAATVRVFAVQSVDTAEGSTPRGNRIVAVPNMGHGSGFGVSGEDHLVVTAAHVVEDARYVVVRLPGDGNFYPARVAYANEEHDVAILAIEGAVPGIVVRPADYALRTRQAVFTVGYPLDAGRRQAQSSRGIVGGVRDNGNIQLDMDVNPGNSGGPVIDDEDHVVGMLVARGDVEQGVQGLAVAVPVSRLHAAVAAARGRLAEGRVAALPSDSARAAHVIATLSEVGLMRVLREASDVTEGTADTAAITRVRALNEAGLSPDMQVFVAAFLWDASQMLMFRAGDHVTPLTMEAGPTRTLAEELLAEARALLASAATADPTIVDRSPFARVGAGGAGALSPEATRAFAEAFPASSAVALPQVPASAFDGQTIRWWRLEAGVGVGVGGLHTRGHTNFTLGPAVYVEGAVQLRVARALVLRAGLDLLVGGGLEQRSSSSGEYAFPATGRVTVGEFTLGGGNGRSFGGGLTVSPRLSLGSRAFVGGAFRLGVDRYDGQVCVAGRFDNYYCQPRYTGITADTWTPATSVQMTLQLGGEAGFDGERVSFFLRGLAGLASVAATRYSLTLHLAVKLLGGEL